MRRSMAAGERELFWELNVEPEGTREPAFRDSPLSQQLMEDKDKASLYLEWTVFIEYVSTVCIKSTRTKKKFPEHGYILTLLR